MNRLMVLGILVWMGIALHAQSLYPDFSKLNFGCDGNSITAGEQWSKTVVDKLGFATHHNVAVGSATWACHPDTQDYGSEAFAGISGGWQVTEDKHELQMRHNNVSKVHIQKFICLPPALHQTAPGLSCNASPYRGQHRILLRLPAIYNSMFGRSSGST